MNGTNPEDRLRDALGARAGAARTSPDALDGVFTKVSRHRRNVRVAAAAGTALSIAAVALVANAAIRPDRRGLVVTSPSPSVSAAAPVPTASASTSPSPSPVAAAVTAFVVRADRGVAEVDVATGAVLRTVANVPDGAPTGISVSRDRTALAYHAAQCHVNVLTLATGTEVGIAGYAPALSSDGRRVALGRCMESGSDVSAVTVHDLDGGKSTTYEPRANPSPKPHELDVDRLAAVSSIAWVDEDTLAVARAYEGAEETLLLELGEDRWLTDGTRTGVAADDVAARGGPVVGTVHCCYPEFKEPVKVVRLRAGAGPETLFSIPGSEIFTIAVAPDGAILYTEGSELWRWGDGRRTLVRNDVLAVAA